MPASSVFFTFVISVHDPFYGKTRIIRVRYPGPRICRTFAQNCAAVSSQGLPEIADPLGCRPKAGRAAGSFARRSTKADCAARTSPRRSAKADRPARTSPRRSAKADHPARTSPRRSAKADHPAWTSSRQSAKADHPARTSSRRSAKADNGGRLCPAQGFSGRAAGRNGALPYNARKSQFLRNGDVWATESLFLFAVLWLAFLPDQSETGVAGGGKARRPETPAAPRRPAQRPNLSARRRAESPKGKRKGGTPDETRTAALTTTPPEDGWEGSQPKRAQRRGKPAKQPRRSAS